jgi:hypothetical protein
LSTIRAEDRDALHVLPLGMMPIETLSLKQARLIKNVRLESVIEVFSDSKSGSGQLDIEQLPNQFGWPFRPPHKDLVLLRKLAPLTSYDIYSLRILFREQKIPINDLDELQLSPEKVAELTEYMKKFTYPLIQSIYGGDAGDIGSFDDVLKLFRDPDINKVKERLNNLAGTMMIKIEDLPRFLEDYGDVFLSLSYFRKCMDELEPLVEDFLNSVDELSENSQLRQRPGLMETCREIQSTINNLMMAISGRFETFDKYTGDMWEDPSAARFQQVKRFIENYHTTIGGSLCSIGVKMRAWATHFPNPNAGGPSKRVDFIMSEMRQGIGILHEIEANAPKIDRIG